MKAHFSDGAGKAEGDSPGGEKVGAENISGGTYYQILGVPPNATAEEIKLQYRRLALKLHPDKNRDDPNATERFQELQEAYEVLSDVERRQGYDQNSDFILRAFAEAGSGDEGRSDSFLSVPSSRTFWCLLVEAAMGDDAKSVTVLAQQLEDEIWTELSSGGVCGFTLLHFAAFAGRPRAVQALIDLGVNVNAKTQPLCVTSSHQFCRPTPLDLTVFVQNKRARELIVRALQAADATYGGVDMNKLESVWQGLIKHQLLLIQDEVQKFSSKIPTGVRRVLRTEPRWREVIHFPGEDAAAMEKRRTKRALQVWRTKLTWILVGESSDKWKVRLGVLCWNALMMWYSWWLFSFHYFELIQAILVGILLMALTSSLRLVDHQKVWERLPSRQEVQDALPSREQVEAWLEQAKAFAILAGQMSYDFALLMKEEFEKCRDMGFSVYSEDAKPRFLEWCDTTVELAKTWYFGDPAADKDEDGEADQKGKKRPQGVANRIARWMEGKTGSGSGGSGAAKGGPVPKPAAASTGDRQPPRATRARRRPPGRG
mmetsp:Transcript_144016/g.460916  ORF Transcript_144016/g.460916 Transcript_144016/m.460916 type:complete len:543 (-) Transcript_144016:126-1754(-)